MQDLPVNHSTLFVLSVTIPQEEWALLLPMQQQSMALR